MAVAEKMPTKTKFHLIEIFRILTSNYLILFYVIFFWWGNAESYIYVFIGWPKSS